MLLAVKPDGSYVSLQADASGNLLTVSSPADDNDVVALLTEILAKVDSTGDDVALIEGNINLIEADANSINANVATVQASLAAVALDVAALKRELVPGVIRSASAAFSASGDTLAIDISALSGYVVGDEIVVITAIVQKTDDGSTPDSIIIKNSAATFNQFVYVTTVGTGLALPVRWALGANNDLTLNKAGTVGCRYSFVYYLRQAAA